MKHTTKLLSIIAVTCLLLGLMGCQPTTGNIGCSHSWDVVIDKEATCTTDGEKHSVCKYCGEETKPETILAHHTWVIKTNATCTDKGAKECSFCKTREDIPALGHNFEETDSVEPTCTEDGHIKYECSRCDVTKTDILPHGHKFNSDDTCTSCYSYKFKFIVVEDVDLSNPKEYTVILDEEYIVCGQNLIETFKKIPEFNDFMNDIKIIDLNEKVPYGKELWGDSTAQITSPLYIIIVK